jgi:hypothetical protein
MDKKKDLFGSISSALVKTDAIILRFRVFSFVFGERARRFWRSRVRERERERSRVIVSLAHISSTYRRRAKVLLRKSIIRKRFLSFSFPREEERRETSKERRISKVAHHEGLYRAREHLVRRRCVLCYLSFDARVAK